MELLETRQTRCPYCDEMIELVIDCSVAEQEYIEDCFVCCQPIDVSVFSDGSGELLLIVKNENGS